MSEYFSSEHGRHVHPDVRVAARWSPRPAASLFERHVPARDVKLIRINGVFVRGGNSVHDAIMRREEYAHDVGAVAEVLRA